MEAFLSWVHEKGCTFEGIEVRSCGDDSGHGIFASRSFRPNETVITVPQQLMITAGMVAELPQYKEVLERGRLQPFEVLVMFFLTEQPYSSSWASYLSVLPSTFSTPAFTESTLNADCLPPSIHNLWVNQQTELKTMFEKMCCLLTNTPSWERFLWAWHVVNTRCIFVENRPHPLVDNSNGDTIAVIPLVDMLNHSTNNQGLALWDSVNGCYKVIATRVVLEGDQLFVCYGGHSNGRLWIDYGFTLPENIYNKVNIDYDLLIALAKSIGINFTDAHVKTIRRAQLPCTLYASDAVPSFGLRANLRILQLRFDQLSRWSEFVYEHDEEGSSELVIAILKKLLENLRRKMDIAPEKFRWLWQEQISLLSECVKNA
ncbi:unnamed protein product [Toxocara canis]|uniref:SET domain-containing protein n=1 Tax=Toxocara canis TaxID=6265 RepID=A0A183UFI5_TOXCA|nr:unnamed protein product [Toxocara canis]